MSNEDYRKAYKSAANELEHLLAEQEKIEDRILALRKTLNVLYTLCQQEEDTDQLDQIATRLETLVQSTLTDDIMKIISAARVPLTTAEVRAELGNLSGSLAEHSNPLATISSILSRLAESGRAHETIKDGKKAWERMTRTTEAFATAALKSAARGQSMPPATLPKEWIKPK